MSVFFIRVWVDGSDIVAVRTGEGQITDAGSYGDATYIDAVAEGAFVDAGTLRPTLSYANNQLSSSLVTLYPAKDVSALLAQAGYTGQSVYNWSDDNLYQWNGNPWGTTSLTRNTVQGIADGAALAVAGSTSTFLVTIFKVSVGAPDTPSGGSYNFESQVVTPPATWSATPPLETGELYISQGLARVVAPAVLDENISWSTPVAFAKGGQSAVSALLTNESHTVAADADGSNPDLTGASTLMRVFLGIDEDTQNWTFARSNSTGIFSTISGNTVTITAMTVDEGFIDITASKSGQADITKRFTVTKSKAGAKGDPGDPGASVLVVYADNASGSNQSLVAGDREFVQYFEYTGSVPSLPVSGTFVRFVGVQGQSIWPIYADTAGGIGQSFSPTGKLFVTFYESLTQPTLPVSGQTFVDYVGADGTDAKLLTLSSTGQIFTFGFDGSASPTLQTITFTASLQNTTDTVATWSTSPTVSLGGSGNTRTLSVASFGSNTSVTVTATADSGAVLDRITVYRVSNGVDGVDGGRGPGRWYIDVDGRHNIATSPITEAEARVEWNFASGSNSIPVRPSVYDQVIFYNGTEANPTKQQAFICTSVTSDTVHTWNEQEALIDGDLLVAGTVTADRLQIGDGSLSSDASGGLLVQGGGITVLRDNFYTANTPINGSGFSSPPNTSDLSLVGGNSLPIPPGFTADLQIVVSFEHSYSNLPGFNDDWGLRITGGFSGAITEFYARYNPTMTLETDYATVTVVKRNLTNPSSTLTSNYNVFVSWGGGSSDIQLLRCLTSVFVRFK